MLDRKKSLRRPLVDWMPLYTKVVLWSTVNNLQVTSYSRGQTVQSQFTNLFWARSTANQKFRATT